MAVIPANAQSANVNRGETVKLETDHIGQLQSIGYIQDISVQPLGKAENDDEWVEFTATAYCSCYECCEKWAVGRPVGENGKEIVYTASGKVAKQGYTIAADWSVLPTGTKVELKGYGVYEVQDRGGAIKGNKIDVYFEDHEEANEWGVKKVKLRVIEVGGE